MNNEYLTAIAEALSLLENEQESISSAAEILASAQKSDKLIHVFGTDQITSSVISEIFFRPGMLTNINPIYDPTLDPAHGAYRNAMCIELDGLAPCILDYYEYIQESEPMIIIGLDPDAVMFRQALSWATEKGLKTIAVISEGKKCDADVVIRYGEQGYLAALSALMGMLMDETVKKLSESEKHTWKGCLTADSKTIDGLLYRIRHL